jgi:hypothetical protein
VGNKPKPDPEELEELKAQLSDHEERIAAVEAACRAFAVVFAIPRITPGDGDK